MSLRTLSIRSMLLHPNNLNYLPRVGHTQEGHCQTPWTTSVWPRIAQCNNLHLHQILHQSTSRIHWSPLLRSDLYPLNRADDQCDESQNDLSCNQQNDLANFGYPSFTSPGLCYRYSLPLPSRLQTGTHRRAASRAGMRRF